MNRSQKAILFIMVSLGLFFFASVAYIFSALMGGAKFYSPLIIGIFIGVLVLVAQMIFRFMKPKTAKIGFLVFFLACGVSIAIYEGMNAYQNSFGQVSDEADMFEYQPFEKESNLATLNEPATLKLEEDLPVLDGATALYPIYAAFAQAVYPEKHYPHHDSEVMVNTTPDAFMNLIDGRADIIFAAGPSEKQVQDAEQAGKELELTPIGKEAFVFFVSADNPVEELTIEQIQDIYSGKVANWKELGGKDEKIRAYQRPEGSGSQTALLRLMGDVPLMEAPEEDLVDGMGGIIAETAVYRNYNNAIGFSYRYFSTEMVDNHSIRHLRIEGVYPDVDSIRNGEYPIAADFYAITAGSVNPNTERLIDWILSEQGQFLIKETGYVSLEE